jgi:2'-deoxynucleoside 5'-phosphate N-hydrolase
MNKKVYFAGSIRGGQNDTQLYHEMIEHINQTDTVLTEHVGDVHRSIQEQTRDKDSLIYEQDTTWLRECDLVIAECTHPSLGVGYELAYAEKYEKPTYIFYRKEETMLSAMLKGNPYFNIESYSNKKDLFDKIDKILK